jgi:hypothetical protein
MTNFDETQLFTEPEVVEAIRAFITNPENSASLVAGATSVYTRKSETTTRPLNLEHPRDLLDGELVLSLEIAVPKYFFNRETENIIQEVKAAYKAREDAAEAEAARVREARIQELEAELAGLRSN